MTFSVLAFDNKVGILTDANLLKRVLATDKNSCKLQFLEVQSLEDMDVVVPSDVGIWIQNFYEPLFDKFKINILIIHEEWFDHSLDALSRFDHVICKSKYAKDTFFRHLDNVVTLPFISKDMYDPSVATTNSYLHFAGRAIQKNTELLDGLSVDVTLIDPDDKWESKFEIKDNIQHIRTYETDSVIRDTLNSHNIHICCSLYEAWGHYAFEGLSTGAELICSDIPVFREQLDPSLVHFIPTTSGINMDYCYCADNSTGTYPLRKAFFVDKQEFTHTLEHFRPIGKGSERRALFRSIIQHNENQLIRFFNSL
jgi:hypothetical protein